MMRINIGSCLLKLRNNCKYSTYKQTIIKYSTNKHDHHALPYECIPGPKPLPLIGNMWRFVLGDYKGMDIVELHQTLYNTFGNIAILKGIWGRNDVIFLFSPDDFETMYRNEGRWPFRDNVQCVDYYRSVIRRDIFEDATGVGILQGEKWYKFRSLVNPSLMQPKIVNDYIESMNTVADDFLINIDKLYTNSSEMPHNFESEITKWTFESLSYLALNKRFGCLEENPPKEALQLINSNMIAFRLLHTLDMKPSIWKYFPTEEFKTFVEHMDIGTFIALKHIDETIEIIKRNQKVINNNEKCILEKILESDRKVAITMAMDMYLGGLDTTTKTMAAALYYLAKNTEVQTKLRTELKSLMPCKDTPITSDILAQAKYLKATLQETMRIAPVSVGNFRTTVKDMALCGYQIPSGVDILTCNLLLCRSDKYFPRSKDFIPERFLRSTTNYLSSKKVHPFVFLPFGIGPRTCIGRRLANLMLEIALAKIIRNYYLDWPHDDMKFGTTLIYGMTEPLRLHLKNVTD